jgi:hypothetical protein
MPDKPFEYAANLLKRGTEKAKQQARFLALQGQILRLRGEKERLILRMGQKVYALFEQDLVQNADLLALCREAQSLDRQVAEREAEIDQLRAGGEEEPGATETGRPPATADAPTGADVGDTFLRSGTPQTPRPAAEPTAVVAEATPGADPTAEPPSLGEIALAPVELLPDSDRPIEIPSSAEPPPAEATPGADPTAEPSEPVDGVPSEPPGRSAL